MWKKEVLFLLLFAPSLTVAEVLSSDVSLLNQAPSLDEDHIDPYWDLAWHEKVASYGDPDSQFFMAQVFEQGKLVPQNRSKAIEYYQKAAKQKHIESCLKLGELLPDEAEKWYLIAAQENDAMSQIRLSQYYEKIGKKEDAILWLEKAFRLLFPNVSDLTTVSPDLRRLKEMK